MRFGLRKLTLLDYPGMVACTVFSCGCNFACPFCHNASLVNGSEKDLEIDGAELAEFFAKRSGILDGVCFTGGEPLLHNGIGEMIRAAKQSGLKVKLDTNGSFPAKLAELLGSGDIDYVAMDIKNSPAKYDATCGRKGSLDAVLQSIEILLGGKVDYEFRTTVVSGFHTPQDFAAIGNMIRGAKRYFLQSFVDSGDILGDGSTMAALDDSAMQECLAAVKPFVGSVQLRGR